MTCAVIKIEFLGNVNEGQSIKILYTLLDEDGAELQAVDALEYKLSDGTNILIDWTTIPAVAPSGSIDIPGVNNRNSGNGLTDRYLTVHSTLSGKDSFKPSMYSLIDDPNVTAVTPAP